MVIFNSYVNVYQRVASGKRLHFANLKMAIEIVDLPIENGGIFPLCKNPIAQSGNGTSTTDVPIITAMDRRTRHGNFGPSPDEPARAE